MTAANNPSSPALNGPYKAVLEKLRRPSRPVVYHYTSPQGLLGIVQTGKISATDIRYLNDSREFDLAHSFVEKYLTLWRDANPNEAEKQVYNSCLKALSITAHGYQFFAAAFSEAEDQLSQWRAYAPPSGGFAVGLSSTHLREAEGLFIPCVYDETEQMALLQLLVNSVLREARQQKAKPDPTELWDLHGSQFLNGVLLLAASFKHHSFKEEQEWRLIQWRQLVGVTPPLFRDGRTGIIPYVALTPGANNLQIADVIVGPGPHAELAKQAAVGLLRSKGLTGFNVRISSTPYRPW